MIIIAALLVLILLALLFPRAPLTPDEKRTNRSFVRFLLWGAVGGLLLAALIHVAS